MGGGAPTTCDAIPLLYLKFTPNEDGQQNLRQDRLSFAKCVFRSIHAQHAFEACNGTGTPVRLQTAHG